MNTSAIEPIQNEGYVNARAFYDKEDESLSVFDSLDGLLRSLGLRMEQRAGKIYIYDRSWLIDQEAEELKVRGADAVLVSDESYTAVNIELDSKVELNSVEYKHPRVEEGEQILYPRIDRPDVTAYGVRLKPIPNAPGSYHASTTPKNIGEKDDFIALCFQPTQLKGALLVAANEVVHQTDRSMKFNYNSTRFIDLQDRDKKPGEHIEHTFRPEGFPRSRYWSIYPPKSFFGLEEWPTKYIHHDPTMFDPWMYLARPLAHLELDVPTGKDVYLGLEANAFVSTTPSLYQELKKEFAAHLKLLNDNGVDMRYSHERENNTLHFPFRSMLIKASLTLSTGYAVYALTYDEVPLEEIYKGVVIYSVDQAKRHKLKWVKVLGVDLVAHRQYFYIPFGGEKLDYHSWQKASSEYIDLGVAEKNIGTGHNFEDFWAYEGLYNKGLYIPTPPVAGHIELQIYSSISFGYAQERASGGRGSKRPYSQPDGSYKSSFAQKLSQDYAGTLAMGLVTGHIAPSYVLLKDIKLSVINSGVSDTKASSEEKIKKTARLDSNAYEVLDLEPLLSTDMALPSHSPVILRDRNGKRIEEMYRVNWQAYRDRDKTMYHYMIGEDAIVYGSTTEYIASEAFAHYGRRMHKIEGTFRSPEGLKLHRYAGHEYILLDEEQDLRACRSDMTLAEISKGEYTPTLSFGHTEERDNKNFIVE